MKKIAIIGSAGAGKSTLARALGVILKIEAIHLDRLFWQPGWKEMSREERIKILLHLVQLELWIIEGSYFTTSDSRLKEADTIIFLDMPWLLCIWRVFWRRIKYSNHKPPRPDLPEGCPERLSVLYLIKVLTFPFIGRRTIKRKFSEVGDKNIITLHSPKAVRCFLEEQMQLANANSQAQGHPLEMPLREAPVPVGMGR